MYKVFTRTFWRNNPAWPDGREPGLGKKTTLKKNIKTEAEAQQICRDWNRTHEPGKLSRKAEYEET